MKTVLLMLILMTTTARGGANDKCFIGNRKASGESIEVQEIDAPDVTSGKGPLRCGFYYTFDLSKENECSFVMHGRGQIPDKLAEKIQLGEPCAIHEDKDNKHLSIACYCEKTEVACNDDNFEYKILVATLSKFKDNTSTHRAALCSMISLSLKPKIQSKLEDDRAQLKSSSYKSDGEIQRIHEEVELAEHERMVEDHTPNRFKGASLRGLAAGNPQEPRIHPRPGPIIPPGGSPYNPELEGFEHGFNLTPSQNKKYLLMALMCIFLLIAGYFSRNCCNSRRSTVLKPGSIFHRPATMPAFLPNGARFQHQQEDPRPKALTVV